MLTQAVLVLTQAVLSSCDALFTFSVQRLLRYPLNFFFFHPIKQPNPSHPTPSFNTQHKSSCAPKPFRIKWLSSQPLLCAVSNLCKYTYVCSVSSLYISGSVFHHSPLFLAGSVYDSMFCIHHPVNISSMNVQLGSN